MSLLSTNGAAQSVPDFSSSVKQNAYQSDNSSYGVQSFDEVYSNAHSNSARQRQNSNDDSPADKSPSQNAQKQSSQAAQAPQKASKSKASEEKTESSSNEEVETEKTESTAEADDKEAAAVAEASVSTETSTTEEALLAEALKSQKTDEETAESADESEELLTLVTVSESKQSDVDEGAEPDDVSLLDQAQAASQVVDTSTDTSDENISDDEVEDTAKVDSESVGEEILTTAASAQEVVQNTAKSAAVQDTTSLEVDDSLQSSAGLKAEVTAAATKAQTEGNETADLDLEMTTDQTTENLDTDLQHFKLPDNQNQTTKTGQSSLPTLESVNDKPVQMSIAKPVTEPDWGEKVMDRVRWMANATQQKAEIRLDPPDLGPLKVEVSIKNEHAQVTMTSHSSQVREILDQHLPRLREALESQGFQSVDAQTQDGQQQQNPEQKSGGNQRLGNLATGEEEMVESTIIVGNSSKGRVDCYI